MFLYKYAKIITSSTLKRAIRGVNILDFKIQKCEELKNNIDTIKYGCVYDAIGLILSFLAFVVFVYLLFCSNFSIGTAMQLGNFIACIFLIIVASAIHIFFVIELYVKMKKIKGLKEELKRTKNSSL